MPTALAKKAAGTFVPDPAINLPEAITWATQECRTGSLAATVRQFCEAQAELLDPTLVVVERLDSSCIHCRIPCRCYDHETEGTFGMDVEFRLNPVNGECQRS